MRKRNIGDFAKETEKLKTNEKPVDKLCKLASRQKLGIVLRK